MFLKTSKYYKLKSVKLENTKKEKGLFLFYALFLVAINMLIAPMTMTITIRAIIAGMKYRSAADCASGVEVGAVVVASLPTVRYVESLDGPYALEPAKVAIIWYVPGMLAVNGRA